MLFVAGCALSFAAGTAAGRMTRRASRVGVMDPDVVVASLTRDLQLDTAQQRVIRAIFERHQHAVDAAWASVQPHVRAAIDSSQMEVLDVLRADQRGRFLALVRSAHPGMPVKQQP